MSDAQTAMNALTDLVTTPAFDQGKVPVPLKALGHLAAALGYEERGQRAEAEFYLGLALAELPYDMVAPASVTGRMLRSIYQIAAGTAQKKRKQHEHANNHQTR